MRGLRRGLGLIKRVESPAQIVSRLLAEATIPTRNGILTVTSTATVDPDTGAVVPVNTANGRSVQVGGVTLPGAALLAQGASTGVMGTANLGTGLLSNTAAPGIRPSERTIVENTANSAHFANASAVTLTDGLNYVLSAEVRLGVGTRNFALLCSGAGNAAGAVINLTTGVITHGNAGTGSVIRSSQRLLSNGNTLFQVTITATAWGGSPFAMLRMSNGTSIFPSYTGDGVSSLIISGYDIIQGEYARTPLAWDGSLGVSRVANLLSWNQGLDTTAGTIIACVMSWGRSGVEGPATVKIYDSNQAGSRLEYTPANQNYSALRQDAVPNARLVNSALTAAIAGQQVAVAQRWDSVSNRITINGVTVFSGTPTLPFETAVTMQIGGNSSLIRQFDGHVVLAKWNRALTEAEVNAWIASTTILVP